MSVILEQHFAGSGIPDLDVVGTRREEGCRHQRAVGTPGGDAGAGAAAAGNVEHGKRPATACLYARLAVSRIGHQQLTRCRVINLYPRAYRGDGDALAVGREGDIHNTTGAQGAVVDHVFPACRVPRLRSQRTDAQPLTVRRPVQRESICAILYADMRAIDHFSYILWPWRGTGSDRRSRSGFLSPAQR